jgi:hypothetical protein
MCELDPVTPDEVADWYDVWFGRGNYYKTQARDIQLVESGKRAISGAVSTETLEFDREVCAILKARYME